MSLPSKRDGRVDIDPLLLEAVSDVDRTLLQWFQTLSIRQRLRAASTSGSALLRFRREATEAS